MRKALFLVFVFSLFLFDTNAQLLDSNILTRSIERGNKPIVTALDNQTKLLKDSVVAVVKTNAKVTAIKTNETVADFITFLPIAMFLFILLIILFSLKKAGAKLSDFLVDKDAQLALKKEETSIAVAKAKLEEAKINAFKLNPQAFGNANIAFEAIEQPAPKKDDDASNNKAEQSTSRLIAFISGLTSVALACCITTFYFYRSYLGDPNVSIGNLVNVLYGLGLGVIPYGFNKIASALK